jgi:NCAIR mutase (PurE)-related protein
MSELSRHQKHDEPKRPRMAGHEGSHAAGDGRTGVSPAGAGGLEGMLAAVAAGTLSAAEAAGRLREGEVRYLDGYAALDLGRAERKGVPEIVYARGKTPEQVAGICAAVLENAGRVIVSTPTAEQESRLRASLPGDVPLREAGRSIVVGHGEPEPTGGRVVAISAGTSDLPVLEEAVAVAREMGVAVKCFHDVGVAGIHRLAEPLEQIRSFDPDCVIVAAGMEGALPTVVSALVAVPVIGLPTSTGYGLGGDGTAAILGMLQSCSPGLSWPTAPRDGTEPPLPTGRFPSARLRRRLPAAGGPPDRPGVGALRRPGPRGSGEVDQPRKRTLDT